MKILPLVAAAALAAWLGLRGRRSLHAGWQVVGWACVAGLVAVGTGLVPVPDLERILERLGEVLGPWTYVLVGVLAFAETGAFIGLLIPGETGILAGAAIAAQGDMSLLALIAVVWTCAVLGDLTSYVLGRRLGRDFLVRHGPRLKVTEERLELVEAFFARHGGAAILIGRFIGFVRAIAPFVAGASRMPMRRFLPYDVLGAGLWGGGLCVLGYVFGRSLGQVTSWLGRGSLALAAVVAIVAAIVFARRLARDPALRARTWTWIAAQEDRPVVGPLARHAPGAWRRFGRPVALHALGPARWVRDRVTPGHLGLELTTLLALLAVGTMAFFAIADELTERPELAGDAEAAAVADAVRTAAATDALNVLTDLGAFPFVAAAVLLTAGWAALHGRAVEAVALVIGFLLTWLATDLAKAWTARERPVDPYTTTRALSYPSGHTSNATALIACAVVLVRAGHGLAVRFAAVTVAAGVVVFVGASRIYLRAHYLSDVVGGAALGAAVLSLVGIVALVVAFVRHNGAP